MIDFQNSSKNRLERKFATKMLLNFIPHLQSVTTLLCEVLFGEYSTDRDTTTAN